MRYPGEGICDRNRVCRANFSAENDMPVIVAVPDSAQFNEQYTESGCNQRGKEIERLISLLRMMHRIYLQNEKMGRPKRSARRNGHTSILCRSHDSATILGFSALTVVSGAWCTHDCLCNSRARKILRRSPLMPSPEPLLRQGFWNIPHRNAR